MENKNLVSADEKKLGNIVRRIYWIKGALCAIEAGHSGPYFWGGVGWMGQVPTYGSAPGGELATKKLRQLLPEVLSVLRLTREGRQFIDLCHEVLHSRGPLQRKLAGDAKRRLFEVQESWRTIGMTEGPAGRGISRPGGHAAAAEGSEGDGDWRKVDPPRTAQELAERIGRNRATHAELAKEMGINPSTVRRLIAAAIRDGKNLDKKDIKDRTRRGPRFDFNVRLAFPILNRHRF